MEGFGKRMIALRERKGWTRRALAKQAGLHEKHLSKVELGERQRVEADTIIQLAQALNVSADYLLGLIDEPTPHRRRKRQLQPAPDEEAA